MEEGQRQQKPFYEDEEELERDQDEAMEKLDKKIGWHKAPNGDGSDGSDGNNKGHKDNHSKKKDNAGDNEKRKFIVYKYSDRQKSPLHEAVIIQGSPCLLYVNSEGRLEGVKEIEENTRMLRPPNPEEYPYLPYEFDSLETNNH